MTYWTKDSNEPGVGGGSTAPVVVYPTYLDIRWTHTEPYSDAHKGFRIAIFTGNNPNDASSYLCDPIEVGKNERRVVTSLTRDDSVSAKAAIQSLYYNGNESSWRLVDSSVVTDPDTVTLATEANLAAVSNAAHDAQTTADGKINSYFQTTPPTGMTSTDVGDIWFDTDDGNKVYRWSGTQWLVAQDSGIARAIGDAATAQGTADGKSVIYYQTSAPTGRTASDQGDLWVDIDDNMKVYAWSGTAWVLAQDWYSAKSVADSAATDAIKALQNAATAQSTADGKINSYFQTTAPTGMTTADVGDIWFDTDDGNKVYRWSGTQWLVAQDSGIAKAIGDASTAQGTADGKATIFYQPSAPTGRSAADQGDLWVDTDDNMKVYAWSGTVWMLAQDWYSANSAASAASASAASAHTSLETIADDSVLSKGEKPQVIIDWEAAKKEHDVLYAQMQANGLTTDPYLDAYAALQTYMGGLGYNSTTWVLSDQAIDPQSWRSVWSTYYSTKSSLILNLGASSVPIIQAATTAGVNLSTNSSLVVDGYTCVGGETIMVKNNGSDNGLYSVLYTAGGASAQTIHPTTHAVSEGSGNNSTDGNGYVSIVPSLVGTITYGVAWSGFPVVSSTSGTLTVILGTTSTDEIQPVVVYYSTDGGGTWSVLGSSADNSTHTYTQALSGVALSQVQVKVTTHTARSKVWNPDFGQWEFMIENSTALVQVVQISTTATGSANYSLVYQGSVSDKSAWSVLSGSIYGTKKWIATVSGSSITLTLSPDQSGTVGNATTTAAGLVKVGSGLSVTSDGTLSVSNNNSYSVFTSSANGLVPASGGGSSNFLRADGSWATPPSSGSGVDSNTDYQMRGLGVGVSASGVAGEIRATDNVTAYYSSDARLKKDICPIKDALHKVNSLTGAEFNWTPEYIAERGGVDGYFIRSHDVGVIAQEVLQVVPEAVAQRNDGTLAVRYDKLVPLLIEAVKELSRRVAYLESK